MLRVLLVLIALPIALLGSCMTFGATVAWLDQTEEQGAWLERSWVRLDAPTDHRATGLPLREPRGVLAFPPITFGHNLTQVALYEAVGVSGNAARGLWLSHDVWDRAGGWTDTDAGELTRVLSALPRGHEALGKPQLVDLLARPGLQRIDTDEALGVRADGELIVALERGTGAWVRALSRTEARPEPLQMCGTTEPNAAPEPPLQRALALFARLAELAGV